MKFPVAALFAALTTACFAQRARIASPANHTSVTPGSDLVVQVVQPNSQTSFTEVAVVLAILACNMPPSSTCLSPSQALGIVLYNGPFHRQYPMLGSSGPPQQNFTVTIPSTLPAGPAQLSMLHVLLNGALNGPFWETQAVSLTVV